MPVGEVAMKVTAVHVAVKVAAVERAVEARSGVMPRVTTVAVHAQQREHELAYHHGAADDRCNQEDNVQHGERLLPNDCRNSFGNAAFILPRRGPTMRNIALRPYAPSR